MNRTAKPNYTQIPNSILDNLGTFSDVELRVILVMSRQTFGWNREQHAMSVGFMAKGAGLSYNGASGGISSLLERGYINRTGDGTDTRVYSINLLDESTNWLPHAVTERENDAPPPNDVGLPHAVTDPLPHAVTGKKERVQKKGKKAFEPLPDVPEELQTPEVKIAWDEWIRHRQDIRQPLTPLAATKVFNQLRAWGAKAWVCAVNNAISSAWRGLYEPRHNGNGNGGYSRQPSTRDLVEAKKLLDEEIAYLEPAMQEEHNRTKFPQKLERLKQARVERAALSARIQQSVQPTT